MLRGVSISHNRIGDCLTACGRHLEALQQFRSALAVVDEATAKTSTTPELRRDLVATLSRIGDDPAAGRSGRGAARSTFGRCREVLRDIEQAEGALEPGLDRLLKQLENEQ